MSLDNMFVPTMPHYQIYFRNEQGDKVGLLDTSCIHLDLFTDNCEIRRIGDNTVMVRDKTKPVIITLAPNGQTAFVDVPVHITY